MTRLTEIFQDLEGDQLNLEKCIKELTDLCSEMFQATGSIFEQEHFRFIKMVTSVGGGGAVGEASSTPRGSWSTV